MRASRGWPKACVASRAGRIVCSVTPPRPAEQPGTDGPAPRASTPEEESHAALDVAGDAACRRPLLLRRDASGRRTRQVRRGAPGDVRGMRTHVPRPSEYPRMAADLPRAALDLRPRPERYGRRGAQRSPAARPGRLRRGLSKGRPEAAARGFFIQSAARPRYLPGQPPSPSAGGAYISLAPAGSPPPGGRRAGSRGRAKVSACQVSAWSAPTGLRWLRTSRCRWPWAG